MDLEKEEPELKQKSGQRTGSFIMLIKNAAFNSGAWGINVVVTLLSTPLIVYKLTIEGYGIYALLTSLIGYYSLMDLGIGQGITKFVAEYQAKGDQEGISQAINGALLVQVATGLVASILLIVFAEPILHLLRVSPQFWEDATLGLYISAVGFFFMMIASTLSSALMGLQRYDLTSTVGGILNIVLTGLIVIVLSLGAGLKEVIYLTGGSGLVMTVIYWVFLRRLLPDWRISMKINWKLLLNLFNFSAYLFISKISNLFSTYIVRFVVGAFLGPAMVTYYVVPAKLINAVGSLLGGSAMVLFPFASELGSLQDKIRVQKLFLSGSRLFAAMSVPLFLTLYIAARPILTIWMGPEFAQRGSGVLGLLALASLIGSLTVVPNLVTMGLGHSRVIGLYSILNIVMYAIFLPLFTDKWGLLGTAWAMLLVTMPSFGLIVYQARRIVQVPLQTYLRMVINFHLIPLIISVILGLLISRFVFPSAILASLVPIIYCALYFGIMMVVGIIPLQELQERIKGKYSSKGNIAA